LGGDQLPYSDCGITQSYSWTSGVAHNCLGVNGFSPSHIGHRKLALPRQSHAGATVLTPQLPFWGIQAAVAPIDPDFRPLRQTRHRGRRPQVAPRVGEDFRPTPRSFSPGPEPGSLPVSSHHGGGVAAFGHPRITACSPLPVAFRWAPRPSSAPGPKASTRRLL
jgi:hypothetical protein